MVRKRTRSTICAASSLTATTSRSTVCLEDVDKDHISAKVEDGIPSIELPKIKKEEANVNGRKIEIK